MTLESPGVVELDISVVPDVLGQRAPYGNAEPIRVLPGRAQNSGCVLIPEARATPRGFHDAMLVDMSSVSGPTVSMGEMSDPQVGRCSYCRRNIVHDMARHVSTYHLDWRQLWRCQVSWCSQWKGTPQDCIFFIFYFF